MKYISVSREQKLCESLMFFYKNCRLEPEHYKSVRKYFKRNMHRSLAIGIISWSELVRRHVYQLKFMIVLFNHSYLKKVGLDWHQKSDFELNFNLHLRHSCNQNIEDIVTWG